MESDTERLLSLKKKIEGIRTKRAQAEGRLDELNAQLSRDFGVTNLDEAKAKLAALEGQSKMVAEEIRKGIEELEGLL